MSSRIKISSMPSSLSRRVHPSFPRKWGSGEPGRHTHGRDGDGTLVSCIKKCAYCADEREYGRPVLGRVPINPNSRTPQPVAGQKE